MSSMSWFFANGTESRPSPGELIKDHRARLAIEERERAETRRLELEEQRSSLNTPEVRIRTWEKVHGLRMPSDASHPILDVIAVGTRLTLAEVREEQHARSLRRAAGAKQSNASKLSDIE
jgi:hypothetical protein